MKFSEISLEDKERESLNLILEFSRNVIADIDKQYRAQKPKFEEIPFIDLMVESYFSIQSFCVLIKEGLISSASAILRIILEQVSIVFLLSKNQNAKKAFEEIKLEKQKYYSSDDAGKAIIEDDLLQNKNIKKHKIKQYFDYGWYKEAGCKGMNLKSICEAANTSAVYEMVDVLLNEFVHGQRSIFQFHRQNNGVDKWFITSLHLYLLQLFFALISATVHEYGESVFSKENHDSITMLQALHFDIRSRMSERKLIDDLKKDDLSSYNSEHFLELIYQTLVMLDKAKDTREKYLLSQAYIRLVKQVITLDVYIKNRSKKAYDIDPINIRKLLENYQPDLSKYQSNFVISLDRLIEMLDIVDDDWGLGDNDIDYAFTHCITDLLEVLRIKND